MVSVHAGSLALPLSRGTWAGAVQADNTTTPPPPSSLQCVPAAESVPAHLHVPPPPQSWSRATAPGSCFTDLHSIPHRPSCDGYDWGQTRPLPHPLPPTSRCLMDTQSARAVSADLTECVMSTVRPVSGQFVVWWLVLYPARGIQSTRQRSGAV